MLKISDVMKGNWPVGKSPVEVGRRIASYIVSRELRYVYAATCAYYGALIFSDATHDTDLRNRVIANYEPFLMGDKSPRTGHVDNNLFGIVPFEIYRQTKEKKYLAIAKLLANDEWENPRPDGLTKYTRFTADDPYMVGSLQAQAYKATGDIDYADRGAKFILAYAEKLQRPDGLFIYDENRPIAWGRGNGWCIGGMTEMLLAFPEDHAQREALMEVYRKQIDGLIKHQDETGMWHQVIDNPHLFLESSGTGIITYAIATGVEQGWLPEKTYRDVAERAWLALTDYVDEQGQVRNISSGHVALIRESMEFYAEHGEFPKDDYPSMNEVGDFHGQAVVLWAAAGMERISKQ